MKILDRKDWFEKELRKLDNNIDSLTYKYILDFSENVLEILDKRGIKNKNKYLAKKLNCSPANISKLFNGRSNFTIRKLIELSAAVDYDLNISLIPKLTVLKTPLESAAIINVGGQLVDYTGIVEHQTMQFGTSSETLISEQEAHAA
jgi:transcriptional regulator with XRE-family HTH domain